jgi:hypothetical protein
MEELVVVLLAVAVEVQLALAPVLVMRAATVNG